MTATILVGDVRERLRDLPDASVHCVVTSPPYWGLRDYGVDGQIGLEETPEQFVEALAQAFAEVRRVLRRDGTLWLNLGDSWHGNRGGDNYSGLNSRWNGYDSKGKQTKVAGAYPRLNRRSNLKRKDLVGIPWRVAFALQADGWWLRSDIIWHKPNPMPESVRDRPTKAHEYVFLLTRAARYHYDAAAVRQPYAESTLPQQGRPYGGVATRDYSNGVQNPSAVKRRVVESLERNGGANLRSVWPIATVPFNDAHFATMAPELAERCIRAGCPEGGTVLDPFCGAGTTGLVARRLGRQFIGVELNPTYAEMAAKRIREDAPMFNGVEVRSRENAATEGGS